MRRWIVSVSVLVLGVMGTTLGAGCAGNDGSPLARTTTRGGTNTSRGARSTGDDDGDESPTEAANGSIPKSNGSGAGGSGGTGGSSGPTTTPGTSGSAGTAGAPGTPQTPGVPSSGNPVLDEARAYNLQAINAIRAKANLPPYTMDAKLNDFAQKASEDLASTNAAHRYFSRNANSCQCSLSAENQGDPSGWAPGDVKKQIDEILDLMMSEGPGGGHHDNIV
ncbi:MAG: hypothetical protein JNL38_01975, partial [Myxococcales bacterium]|nr:hypothetical protein [Myxococcales bacterium]